MILHVSEIQPEHYGREALIVHSPFVCSGRRVKLIEPYQAHGVTINAVSADPRRPDLKYLLTDTVLELLQ